MASSRGTPRTQHISWRVPLPTASFPSSLFTSNRSPSSATSILTSQMSAVIMALVLCRPESWKPESSVLECSEHDFLTGYTGAKRCFSAVSPAKTHKDFLDRYVSQDARGKHCDLLTVRRPTKRHRPNQTRDKANDSLADDIVYQILVEPFASQWTLAQFLHAANILFASTWQIFTWKSQSTQRKQCSQEPTDRLLLPW